MTTSKQSGQADYQPNVDLIPGLNYLSAPPILNENEEARQEGLVAPFPAPEDLLPPHQGEELLSDDSEEIVVDTATRYSSSTFTPILFYMIIVRYGYQISEVLNDL